ncbi:MAG: tripartite tricarboxylate transporter TctB family protein, partial [Gammaproteobacteria bacterium]
MGKLRPGHIIETAFWLVLAGFLYVESFAFNKSIEIYKFGAAGWPRALILLMAIAAVGQLLYQYYAGDRATGSLGAATDDGSEEAARAAGHSSLNWYASTCWLLVIPFVYMRA